MKEKEEDSKPDNKGEIEAVPSQIQAFAAKLGEETDHKFTCYIYRVVHDEETGRQKRPLVHKYVGVEPDPYEIAQKFRAGTYLLQFIWRVSGQQRNKSYTLDVDAEAFPFLPKQDGNAIISYGVQGEMPDNMRLQLAMMHEISEVMKAAYANNNNREQQAADPLEMFSGMMSTMENSFTRAMTMQQKIMERVLERNMENKYGLSAEELSGGASTGDDSGLVGKYAPIVKEVVDGLKMIIGMFGTVPPKVINQVKSSDHFKALLADKAALICVGSALRKQFGDQKAQELMRSFGVRMALRPKEEGEISHTPQIASLAASQGPTITKGSESAHPPKLRVFKADKERKKE